MDRKLLKENARKQLGGGIFQNNWLMGLIVLLLESTIVSAFSFTGVLVVLISGPLAYGVCKVFLNLVYGEPTVSVEKLFSAFKDDFGGILLLGLMQYIFIALWSMLFIIPGIVKYYSYAMSYYIKADHPEYDWQACINASKEMMKGHKMDLFILDLSFIGWIFVGLLVFGIGILWVNPYIECTKANFYAYLAAQSVHEPADADTKTDEGSI